MGIMGQGLQKTFIYCSVRYICAIYSEYVEGKFVREKILLKAFAVRIAKPSSLHLIFGIPAFILKGEPRVLDPARVKN